MANELKPCPFCGGSNLDTYYCDIEGWIAHIKCDDCDDMIGPMSEFKYETKEEAYDDAAKRWNTRPAAPVEGLDTVVWKYRWKIDGEFVNWRFSDASQKHQILTSLEEIELVTRSQAEAIIAAEREALTKEEADHTRSLEERDRYHDVADKLAQAIADRYQADIGEHSNINDPWHNALNLIEADNAALTARVKAETELREDHQQRNKELETQLAAAHKIIGDCLKELDRSQRPSFKWQLRARAIFDSNVEVQP